MTQAELREVVRQKTLQLQIAIDTEQSLTYIDEKYKQLKELQYQLFEMEIQQAQQEAESTSKASAQGETY
jgi:5,10-methylene-tetrahydrofolate dehydrogenase/methenyl tetrahydrofolate cyclohydrolase